MKRSNQLPFSKLVQLMTKIPFFTAFSGSDTAQMANHAQIFIAEPREAVIEKGAKDTCFYIILSGQARVVLNKSDVTELACLAPGDMFGEVGFALNTPRSTWVFATQLSVLLRIDQQLLSSLEYSVRDKVKDQIINKLANTIEAQNHR